MKNSDKMEATGGGYTARNPIPDPADHLHGFQYQEAVDAYVAEHGAFPHDGLAKQQAKEQRVQALKAEYLLAEEMAAAGGYTAWAKEQAATMNTICDQCGKPIPSGKVLTIEIPLPHPTRHNLTEPIKVGPCCEHKPKGADILHPAPLLTV